MEYGNGIMGDMCVHMLDMVRWMLDLGMPTRISSSGGILIDKASKANITDTQTATFDFPNLKVVWIHRSWGDAPDPKYPWGATFYGDKGTLKASVMGYDFVPSGKGGTPVHEDVKYEFEQYPGGQDGEGSRDARRAGDPGAHEEFSRVHRVAGKAGLRHRAGLHVDDRLHPREYVDAARTLAHLGSRQGRGGRRRRGQRAAPPALPHAVGASGSGDGVGSVVTDGR